MSAKKADTKGSQSMQKPVSQWGDEVFFHEHLDGVGQNLKEAKGTETQKLWLGWRRYGPA